jgi:hypothetical protein
VSSTWATYPSVGDNSGKPGLIPHSVTVRMDGAESSNAQEDGPAAYQLVGGVTAYQGEDG